MRGIVLMAVVLGAAHPIFGEPFVENFQTIGEDWHIAQYRFTHPSFDTDWHTDRVQIADGLNLTLEPQAGANNRFVGGSLRRVTKTGFGRYEVELKAATGDGVVTGFFVYTGPYYGTRHDEIDIEFLGQNTHQVHLAWFVDGELRNKFIDLGFDASEQFRVYAFEWRPNSLRWFVDDTLIYQVNSQAAPIPTTPGHLFANIWAADPSISSWAGHAQATQSASSQIRHIAFHPFDETHR